jgi:hypothetical protein
VPRSERATAHINYWEALAALDSDAALISARTPAERAFAESLKSLMVGDMEKAENGFSLLRQLGSDSVMRSAARVMYVAALQYQEKWTALADAARDSSRAAPDKRDKASIEVWSLAFRNLPAMTSEFRARSEDVPMEISAVGTPLIRVQVGVRVFHFWLDTGSSMTMLASDVARTLGVNALVPDTLEIVTSTGRIGAQPTMIPTLRLGQLVMRNVPAMIVDEAMMRMREPMPTGQGAHLKIDGIIGFDIIRRLDIEVDYSGLILKLRDPARSRRSGDRNMFWVGLPVVKFASAGGIPLHFALDTGAQVTFVTETLLEKLQIEPQRTENQRVGGLGGEISMRAPVLSDLRVRLRGFPIIFRGAVVRAPVYQVLASLDGVLGGDIWGAGTVRMDITNGVFAVGPASQD